MMAGKKKVSKKKVSKKKVSAKQAKAETHKKDVHKKVAKAVEQEQTVIQKMRAYKAKQAAAFNKRFGR